METKSSVAERKPRIRKKIGKRPFVLGRDGKPAPTLLEIEEGLAWKEAQEKPTDSVLQERARVLFFERIANNSKSICRCDFCGVVLTGRTRAEGCGYCGHKGR